MSRSTYHNQLFLKMQMIYIFLFACVAITSAFKCPDLPVVQDFELSKYSGTWYQQSSTSFKHFPGACTKTEYTLDSNLNVLNFTNSVKILFKTVTLKVKGYASLENSTSSEGKLRVHVKTPVGKDSADYWVLATDYDNYTIVYSCRQFLAFAFECAWVLTRKMITDEATDQLVATALKQVEQSGGPSAADFAATSQKGC